MLASYPLSQEVRLENRVLMAPMTRRQADQHGCQALTMADYYAKRASAGLIVTEGTLVSADAMGYGNVPGIYTKQQIKAWQHVTKRVHEQGGKIFVQLWHCGRVSHPVFHQGRLPLSASATTMTGPLGKSGYTCGQARAATVEEIQGVISDFAQAADNAMQAGFDGIELHGANGYLIDQFLHGCTNFRQDHYGGSSENQARFAIELVKVCCQQIDAGRVGIRLSPGGHFGQITTEGQDAAVFRFLLSALEKLAIAYVHTGAFDDSIVYPRLEDCTMTQFLRQHYNGTVVACGGYQLTSAEAFIAAHPRNLVAFGRPFLANPDLMMRIEQQSTWRSYDPSCLQVIT